MGIPGILKELGRGERIALSKLAVSHLELHRRPLRIAIDAAIWNFQNQAGQGGANPALRTLFYRLLKLLALPIHPVFVFDGKHRPRTKRGKTVSSYGTCIPNEMSKKLVAEFRWPCHTAPGEAEAECALLQRMGLVDAVMSQDVDAVMFGSTVTLRNWSKEGLAKGNKTATHVDILRAVEVQARSGLTPEGLILVALLSGGDYDTEGVAGFGPSLACEIARAGFGKDLLQLAREGDEVGLKEWRERLQYELEENESGYFKRKHKTLRVPEEFPDRTILGYYTDPAVSSEADLLALKEKWEDSWHQEIDISSLRQYVADKFEWLYKAGATKFTRCLAPSLLAHRLYRKLGNTTIVSSGAIKERRMHFINDGMPELRVEVIPGDVVGLDMVAEEENPGWLADDVLNEDKEGSADVNEDDSTSAASSQPASKRKTLPWDPSAPEKMWIPETIVQLGVPALVEEWKQKQRDIMADPVRFATRKAGKSKVNAKTKGTGINTGALDGYFATSKPRIRADGASKWNSRPRVEREKIPTTLNKRGTRRAPEEDGLPKTGDSFGRSPAKNISNSEDGPKEVFNASLSPPAPSLPKPLAKSQSREDDCIIISSSPPAPSPMAPSERDTSNTMPLSQRNCMPQSPSPVSRLQVVPDAVAQRRTHRCGRRVTKPLVQTISAQVAPPARPPIESFFKPRASTKPIVAPPTLKVGESPSEPPILPPEMSMGLKSSFVATKKIAVLRESLPGTWKELDPAMLGVVTPRTRGRPRISCVDMTGD